MPRFRGSPHSLPRNSILALERTGRKKPSSFGVWVVFTTRKLGKYHISMCIWFVKFEECIYWTKKVQNISIQYPSPHFGLYISIVILHPWCQQKQELRLWLKVAIVKNTWAEPPYECWLYRIGVDMCIDGLGLFWTVWRLANGITGASGVMIVSRTTWLRRCWSPVVLHFMRLKFKAA